METVKNKENSILVFILLLTIIGQASIDIYLPSLPNIVSEMNTSITSIQMSVTMYLIGYGSSQIFYGPLSDRYGRKPILVFGMSLFIISTLLLTSVSTVVMLLIMRILQGVAMGAASVCARAIMRDTYKDKKLAIAASYMAMAWALVPILAPVLGGYIEENLTWKYSFYLLNVIVIAMFIYLLFIKETNNNKAKQLSLNQIIESYAMLFRNRTFNLNIIILSLLFGIFSVTNVATPIIFQEQYSYSPMNYGIAMFFISIGYLIGSLVNKLALAKISSNLLVIVSISLLTTLSIVHSVIVMMGEANDISVTIFIFSTYFCLGFIFANCLSASLSPFPNNAGSASAMYGFMVFVSGFIISYLYTLLFVTSTKSLSISILILGSLMFIPGKLIFKKGNR